MYTEDEVENRTLYRNSIRILTPLHGLVLPMMAYTGRLRPKGIYLFEASGILGLHVTSSFSKIQN